MSKRRALLIGVPEYESDAIPNLPIVRKDLETLHTALEKSGFTVRSLGADGLSHGRSKIRQALIRECKEAQGIEILLLYFSGHGMHFQGKDYLVPSDAVLDYAEFVEECLVPIDLGDIVDQAGADTIIFFVDACREGVKLGFKDISLAGWSRGERRQATRRSFVLVFACGPGQVSQYVAGETGFSLFSQALAEVLDPQHFACTLRDVLDETQVRLNALASEHRKQPQKIYYAHESAVEEDISSRIICNGLATTNTRDKTINPWADAVLQSSFWQEEGGDHNCSDTQLKRQVAKVLAACWQQWQAAVKAFPQDSWRDEELPIRVLRSLELLIFRSNPRIELTTTETALIVTVPFVREAVLASGMAQAAKVSPLSLEAISPKNKLRDALDKIHQTQPRFVRKAERLKEQGRIADKEAVMTWLLHLCLLKTLETWQPESIGGYLADDFIRILDSVESCRSQLVKDSLTRQRLLELAYCMYADFERIDRDDRPNPLQTRLIVGSYRDEQVIREKMLAYLLKLAGLLAIDIRKLSDVLVDHIGLADPLTPEQILHTVNQTRWNPSGQGRTLTVTCNHPAIDSALNDYVAKVGAVLSHMLRQVEDKRGGMEALIGLPTHLQPDGIEAEKRDGTPVYQIPHINFQLAHDEVRELLMGEQLYGDPMLAIRELYQNAMDACRYRDARLKYLKQTGQAHRPDGEWEGRIVFCQSIDENGRAYIECEDNGIGMEMPHLSKCFARAGSRFADLPEFIEEQAEWLKCDPPIQLYPNSQFGVGVLSYFMLADEIEVETCRLDREGRPSERLQVRIPGSSGLFRVRRLGIGDHAGTRVRLYLNRTHHKGQLISCIETLRRLLWVAEFRTEVFQFGRQEIWEPKRFRHPDFPQGYCLNIEQADVWWVPESEHWYIKNGCILSDGLWTRESQPGFVINLRSEHFPKLTVDRKDIVEWNKEWVRKVLIENSDALLKWLYTDFNLLWKLAGKHPQVAAYIVEGLAREDAKVRLGRGSSSNLEAPIAEIGCFEFDTWLNCFKYGITVKTLVKYIPWWVLPYRVILWGQHGLFKISESFLEGLPPLFTHKYCPNLKPGDSLALSKDLPPQRFQREGLQDYVPPAHIVHAAARLGEPLVETAQRFRRFASLGLKIPEIDLESLTEIQISEEDVIAISRTIKESFSFGRKQEQWKFPWIENQISAAQIVLAATRLNESVASTIKRLQRFRGVGLEVIQIDANTLGKIDITPEDIIALSKNLDGEEALLWNRLSPAQILFSAKKLNEPVAETLKRFQKFVPIGLELPDLDIKSIGDISITQEDLIILSEELDGVMEGKIAWSEARLPVAQLVRASQRLNETVLDTFNRLRRFTSLGLQLPLVDFETSADLNPTREDSIAFLEDDSQVTNLLYWKQRSTWLNDQVTPAHLVVAATRLNEPVAESFRRFQRFVPLGLQVPEVNLESLASLVENKDNLIAISKSFREQPSGPNDLLQGNVHPTRIILVALALGEPVPTTLNRFRDFAPILGLTLPEGEPISWQFCTSED
ncbi:MAG: caspase family protein [Stenomitos rutilans HA7619-LM2]|jgi:hypothetical protein|nr:caspase family protein [Stenomitos rutilans HA7619-LM2]